MATWKCSNCGWDNADKWEKCAKCNCPKNPNEEQLKEYLEEKNKVWEFPLTTTHSFEGWNIEKYLGIVSAVVVLGTGLFSELNASIADLIGTRASGFQKKLEEARIIALSELIENAKQRNGTGIIGIDIE
ncbi:MAG: heavy metal-binding domain-containing protein, partial [Anaerolineales bacterium]